MSSTSSPADQWWMPRTSAPNGVASMYRMLSYACSGEGT